MTAMTPSLNTAEVARFAGVHKDTLLRWLRDGRVSEPSRDRRGWRYFTPHEAQRVLKFAEEGARYEVRSSSVQTFDRLQRIDWDFASATTTYLTHGIHPYPAKFIPQIPNILIQELSGVGDTVADIFCGSGTTLVEALSLKRHAIGIDANPLACLISRAKTCRLEPDAFSKLEDLVNRSDNFAASLSLCADATLFAELPFTSDAPRPQSKAIDFWFEPFVVEELAEIRSWFTSLDDEARTLAEASFSSIIVTVSRQDSDTRYVRRSKKIKAGDVFKRFAAALRSTIAASKEFTALVEPRFDRQIHCASVLDAPKISSPDLVVCSPPYPNAYSYHLYHMTRMAWLEMDQPLFKKQEIGSHRKYGSKSPSAATADTFREEMRKIFEWLSGFMRKGSFVCFVVGNSKIKGQIIDNASLVEAEARDFGFEQRVKLGRKMKDTQKAFNPSHGRIKQEDILVLELT